MAAAGEEITVSSVARATGVHRSLIHRHGDLHAAVLARASAPPPGTATGTQVSRQSLLADVANLTARNGRLSAHITRLEQRLSETSGRRLGRPPVSAPPPTSKRSPARSPSYSSPSLTSDPNSPSARRPCRSTRREPGVDGSAEPLTMSSPVTQSTKIIRE
ncbi:hypothetical protein ACFY8W_25855 [Streptomyces sp. NPDC012637]|uniref:hypothetical protein n=1 Tax=Streptomyces sp. NPDC012637 TaxID=3364842 RepID=UPI0036E7247E